MDFHPSAGSVAVATAPTSLNLYHLNLKCCSSFARLAPITEPVAMAKHLNVLCRSSSPHGRGGGVCAAFVPTRTHTHTEDSSRPPNRNLLSSHWNSSLIPPFLETSSFLSEKLRPLLVGCSGVLGPAPVSQETPDFLEMETEPFGSRR